MYIYRYTCIYTCIYKCTSGIIPPAASPYSFIIPNYIFIFDAFF